MFSLKIKTICPRGGVVDGFPFHYTQKSVVLVQPALVKEEKDLKHVTIHAMYWGSDTKSRYILGVRC